MSDDYWRRFSKSMSMNVYVIYNFVKNRTEFLLQNFVIKSKLSPRQSVHMCKYFMIRKLRYILQLLHIYKSCFNFISLKHTGSRYIALNTGSSLTACNKIIACNNRVVRSRRTMVQALLIVDSGNEIFI